MQKLKIRCEDGVELAAILLEPEEPKAVVQLWVGTGAKKEFYIPFAKFLVEHSYAVCTFDYRGTCESAPASLKDCTYNYIEYGTQDMPAVLDFLDKKYPSLPKLLLGHSVGGMNFGLMHNYQKLSGVVAVGSGSGYWRNMPLGYRLQTLFFFYIFRPISVALTGYVAAKRFGIMEDLPRNIVKDWADWCSKPDYFWDEKFFQKSVPQGHYHELSFPIAHFWASDDPIANERNVPLLLKHFKTDKGLTSEKLVPAELGVKKIDHFGFFKRQFRDTIWLKILEKLEKMQ
ncbi:alpha/beta hydrolase-like protein [Emticicia oligotrophica DSM 17448]|uniref:Alpha/beta hydrolase-like protein n=1 Tax=Emticicia oligotrophica (strain DSM 17448 / CIP 109782 / MTCC 6937 / GPTSA100-15) TaxID=929562 RepID=A0ABM5N2F2_EMTOG|nr:alpha/beta fold hydrolase [Emticicia oligotrophica]AFK03483.1 alpha/beta hydrolase-like protein [Emticicia oligotrophica DSM 17448]